MDTGCTGQMMLKLELRGRRKRPKRRFMDVVKDNMLRFGVTEEDVTDRVVCRQS